MVVRTDCASTCAFSVTVVDDRRTFVQAFPGPNKQCMDCGIVAMADNGTRLQCPASSAHPRLTDFSLLRAAPLRVALRRWGAIWENRDGTSESYDLSSPVNHIGSFVSHTWNTPKRKKFMALSLHFGFPLAYASMWLVGCLISTLGALGVLAFAEMESAEIVHRPPHGPYAKLLCPTIFWLVLFLHSDLVPRPSREHQIFLDKVCIHQTDTKLQKEGIAHLSMFLLFSGQLVVLQDDDYLERLWTVYELATFLSLQPNGRVVILPVNLPIVVLVSSLSLTTSQLLNWSLKTKVVTGVSPISTPTTWFSVVVIILPALFVAVFFVVLLRRWATEQEKRAQHLLHRFSIGSAQCTNEDDRAPVMANITALLRNTSRLPNGENAMNVFDTMVRQEVPEALKKSVGHVGVPYVSVLAAGAVFVGNGFDHIGAEIAAGSTVREAFPRCWYDVAAHFAAFPLFLVYTSIVARGCVQLRGFVQCVYLAIAVVTSVLVFFGMEAVLSYFRATAESSDAVLIMGVTVTLIVSLFAHSCLQPHMRAKGEHSTHDDASLQLANRPCLQIQFCGDEVASQTLSSVASEQAPEGISVLDVAPNILGRARETADTPRRVLVPL